MEAASTDYDYIVVGLGGVGSSALYRLAKNTYNKKVLGIEQFQLGHDNGGSQDVSRIIRYSYHELRYISLAIGAYEAWAEVEEESGIQLVHKCGGLDIAERGTPGAGYFKCYMTALASAGIKYETMDGFQLSERFPSFTPKENVVALYQKDGGLVDSGLSIAVHIQLARKYGAETMENTTVTKISRDHDGKLSVSTSRGNFRCRKVVIAAGAWINDVTNSLGVHVPVTVKQEQVTYFGTPYMKEFSHKRFPYLLFHGVAKKNQHIYALPIYSNSGFKIGVDAGGPSVTAKTRTYKPDPVREKICTDVLKDWLPRSLGPILYTKTCLYAMTSDREFVVDTAHRTSFPDVVICCGAGHAFKFASVMGKILANLALDQPVPYDISHWSLDRPAITDPNYKKQFLLTAHGNDATTPSKL